MSYPLPMLQQIDPSLSERPSTTTVERGFCYSDVSTSSITPAKNGDSPWPSPSVLSSPSCSLSTEVGKRKASSRDSQETKRQRTLRACERCKLRKQRCDNESLSACRNCKRAGLPCKRSEGDSVIPLETKQFISKLKDENEQLKKRNEELEQSYGQHMPRLSSGMACPISATVQAPLFDTTWISVLHAHLLHRASIPLSREDQDPSLSQDRMVSSYRNAVEEKDDLAYVVLKLSKGTEPMGSYPLPQRAALRLRQLSLRAVYSFDSCGGRASPLKVHSPSGLMPSSLSPSQTSATIPVEVANQLADRAFAYLSCRLPFLDPIAYVSWRQDMDSPTGTPKRANGNGASGHSRTSSATYGGDLSAGRAKQRLIGWLILCLGAAMSMMPGRADTPMETLCFQEAIQAGCATEKTVAELADIQVYLLLTTIACICGHGPALWDFSGMAMRCAIALNLHVDASHANGKEGHTSSAANMRKHIFWCCYWYDCYCSAIFQRPSILAGQGISAGLPAGAMPLGANEAGFSRTILSNQLSGLGYRLCHAAHQISNRCDTVTGPANPQQIHEAIGLCRWLSKVGHSIDDDDKAFQDTPRLLEAESLFCKYELKQKELLDEGTNEELLRLCVEIADAYCNFAQQSRTWRLDLLDCIKVFEVAMGALLWVQCTQRTHDKDERVLGAVYQSLDLLDAMSQSRPSVKGLAILLEQALKDVAKQQRFAGPAESHEDRRAYRPSLGYSSFGTCPMSPCDGHFNGLLDQMAPSNNGSTGAFENGNESSMNLQHNQLRTEYPGFPTTCPPTSSGQHFVSSNATYVATATDATANAAGFHFQSPAGAQRDSTPRPSSTWANMPAEATTFTSQHGAICATSHFYDQDHSSSLAAEFFQNGSGSGAPTTAASPAQPLWPHATSADQDATSRAQDFTSIPQSSHFYNATARPAFVPTSAPGAVRFPSTFVSPDWKVQQDDQ